MDRKSDGAMDANDDDLFQGWFEETELGAVPEVVSDQGRSYRRARIRMIVAAVSATVLTLVIVIAGRI
jgi:hypothetical protein